MCDDDVIKLAKEIFATHVNHVTLEEAVDIAISEQDVNDIRDLVNIFDMTVIDYKKHILNKMGA